MGKRIVNVLTVCLVLLFALSSCSLDQALDALRGNKYIEWGWTEADTTNVDAVNDAITNIEPENTKNIVIDDGDDGILDLSSVEEGSGLYAIKQATVALKNATDSTEYITIKLDKNQKDAISKGVLATMTGTEKDDFMANINSSLNGAQRDVFVETMQEAADASQQSAAKGSMALASAMISTVTEQLSNRVDSTVQGILDSLSTLQTSLDSKVSGEGSITKADVVQTQMITNLVATAAQVADDMKGGDVQNPLELVSVKTLINDAVTLSNTSKALSGDFDIISDMLGSIMGLIPSGDSGSGTEEVVTRSLARSTEDLPEEGDGDGTTTPEDPDLMYVVVGTDGTVSEADSSTADAIGVYKYGPVLDFDEYDNEASKNDAIRNFKASMEATGDGLEGLFGATKENGIYKVNETVFNRRIDAYRMMSTAYDIIYSVVPENAQSYSEYSFLIDQYKATPNSAIDYALATVLSNLIALVDNKAASDTFNFVVTLNEFLSINPWISNPDSVVEDETCIYLQKSLLDAFGLRFQDLKSPTGWKGLAELLFSANVGFAASTADSLDSNDDVVVVLSEGDVDDMLYYKAGVLDKMMAVGGFDLETILSMFQVDTGDPGEIENITSMKDYVKEMYKNMWTEYSSLENHNRNLRPSILGKNN